MEEGEAKDLEFDRDDVNALKKRLRENKLFDLTPSEERALAAAEKARKEAEERARRAAKEKARKEAEARALAEAPRGSFSFRPEALKLELKEGVEAPAKVAVAFALKMSDEAAELPEWWEAAPPVAVAAKEDGTFDLEGSYLGSTKRFLLSEKSLKGLLGMKVEASLLDVKGEEADAESDPVLATMSVALSDLLVDQLPEFKPELPLGDYEEPPPVENEEDGTTSPAEDASEGPFVKNGSTSFLTVSFTCDDDMTDYALGGCILTPSGVTFRGVPSQWVDLAAPLAEAAAAAEGGVLGADETHAKIAELVGEGALGAAKQTLTLALKDGAPIPPIAYAPGVLSYEPPPEPPAPSEEEAAAAAAEAEAAAAAAAEAGEEPPEPPTPPPKPFVPGTWSLTFATPEPIFMTRASRFHLKTAVADGDPLEMHLTRQLAPEEEGGIPPEPDWVVLVQLQVDDLLVEDSTSATAAVTAQPAPLPEDLMQEEVDLLESFSAARAADLQAAIDGPPAPEKKKKKKTQQTAETATDESGDPVVEEKKGDEVAEGKEGEGEGEAAPPPSPFLSVAPMVVTASLELSRPLRKAMGGAVLQGLTSQDVVPSRRVIPTKPPRNFEEELRSELGDVVQLMAAEYIKMYPPELDARQKDVVQGGDAEDGAAGGAVEAGGQGGGAVGKDEQTKRLLYMLNTSGLYHEFKERLKPRIQRVVRARFDSKPDSPEALDRDLTKLYSYLMSETTKVLNGAFSRAMDVAKEKDQKPTPYGLIPVSEEDRMAAAEESLEKLLILANDAEANGDFGTALARHEDRVAEAAKALGPTTDGPGAPDPYTKAGGYFGAYKTIIADTWFLFGRFCLRAAGSAAASGDGAAYLEYLGKGAECLGTATVVDDAHVDATRLCGAVLLEQGKYEKADAVLQKALDLETPPPLPSDDAERGDESLASPNPLSNVLMCLQRMATGAPVAARSFLGYAVMGFNARGGVAPGKPKRTAVLLAVQAAEYLVESALPGLAAQALGLADKAEAAAKVKAMERGLVSAEQAEAQPRQVLQLKQRTAARLALVNREHTKAVTFAQGACDLDPEVRELSFFILCYFFLFVHSFVRPFLPPPSNNPSLQRLAHPIYTLQLCSFFIRTKK